MGLDRDRPDRGRRDLRRRADGTTAHRQRRRHRDRAADRSASDFDPEGDGRETGTQRLAIDGNPTGTAWTTEHYDTQDFGGVKEGVGIAIDAGKR